MSGLSTAATFLALLVLVRLVYSRYCNGLYGIPGPWLASIMSLWKLYIVWSKSMPWTNAALHEKYGPLVRIGPRHVSASTSEALGIIHTIRRRFQKVAARLRSSSELPD